MTGRSEGEVKPNTQPSEAGFSIIEIVIALAFLGLVLTVGVSVMYVGAHFLMKAW